MENYKFKIKLVESGMFSLYCKIIFVRYLHSKMQNSVLSDSELLFYNENSIYNVDECKIFTKSEIKALRQLFDAHRQKVCRVRKKIKFWFKSYTYVYFLTLTWNDDYLSSLNARSRRSYVSRFLGSLPYKNYHANIDFGSETQREHYHAVLASDVPIKKLSWNYGFSNIQQVNNSSVDYGRVAHYINKLTYHSVKESTGLNRCITPRK